MIESPSKARCEAALELAFQWIGCCDSHDHVLWLVDQMVRALADKGYEDWVRDYNDWLSPEGESYAPWDVGIPP